MIRGGHTRNDIENFVEPVRVDMRAKMSLGVA